MSRPLLHVGCALLLALGVAPVQGQVTAQHAGAGHGTLTGGTYTARGSAGPAVAGVTGTDPKARAGFWFATLNVEEEGGKPQASQKLTLDGDLDYASVTESPDLNFEGPDDNITLEAWIKHDGQSDAGGRIFDNLDDSNRGYDLHLVGSGEEVSVQFTNGGNRDQTITSDAGIPAHRWTHVAVVYDYDGGTLSLYLNGRLDSQQSANRSIWVGDASATIGANDAENGNVFSGEIDELRIWNTARSLLEIKEKRFSELTGSETDLVAYYPFGGDTPTGDPAGNHNLTLQGDAATAPRDVFPVPPDLYVENEGASQVSLRWVERMGLNGANAASDIRLYRAPPTGLNGRSQIAQVGTSGSPTYTASSLSNGKTYFWQAAAVNAEGSESDYSPLVTGTPYDGAEPTPLKGGAALSLDGDLDRATVGNRPSLSYVGQDDSITVEAWVKHDGQSDPDARIFDKLDSSNYGYDLHLVGSGEEVPVQFTNGANSTQTITSNAGLPAHRWTHVAVVYDGNTLSLYLNGQLDTQQGANKDIWGGEAPLQIGANDAGNDHFFSGQIDEARVWDVARTKSEIQAHYQTELTGSEKGLLAYWRFNDAGKGVLQDAAIGSTHRHDDAVLQDDAALRGPGALPLPPRSHAVVRDTSTRLHWNERNSGAADQFVIYRASNPDGTGRTQQLTLGSSRRTFRDYSPPTATNLFYEVSALNGQEQESDYGHAAPVTPSGRTFGNALTLDGTDDYGTVEDRPSLSYVGENDSITVEAWVKHDGQSDADARILDKLDSNNNGYDLHLVGSGAAVPVEFTNGANRTQTITSNATVSAGKWTHVAVVYDGNTLSLYLNGLLDTQQGADKDIWDGDTPLRIGTNDAGNGNFFSGRIEDVRLWDVARTKAEIQANYRRELLGNETGLRGYWRFNETPGTAVSRAAGQRPKTVVLSGDADFGGSALESLTALSTKTVDSDGTVDFDTTGVDATFSGTSGSGDVTVEKFGSTPSTPEGISEQNVSTYRFVLRAGDDLSFDSDTEVRFDVGRLVGVNAPEEVTIYKRAAPGESAFTALSTSYNSSTNELTVTTGSFSEFVFASDSNPLPVEMAGFEGTTTEEGVRLTWKTASETNNAGFRVQRRIGESEGEDAWEQIGRVEGTGTTADAQSYRFVDEDLPYAADALTYRLKQVDTDGTTALSDAIIVKRRTVTEPQLLGTFPNPARSQAMVRFAVPEGPAAGDVTLRLYDVLGREVRAVTSEATAGRHETTLDVGRLPSGLYFLRLKAGTSVKTQRLTVVH